MRKFKLNDKAARRMKELLDRVPETAPAEEIELRVNITSGGATAVVDGLKAVSRTDVGKLRKNNQDALIIGSGLIGVADGMGGHNGGETASMGTRDGLLKELYGKEITGEILTEAVKKVNLELWKQQEADPSLAGMGTTLTVMCPADENILIAHVGDSRAYLLRDGKLTRVTEDHSMVADMVRNGMLTEEQAACHPMRNYITRAVGTEPDIEVDLIRRKREPGDRWLICSDGLHGLVSAEKLEELMNLPNEEEAADLMVRAALDAGGRDNISLVLVTDPPAEEAISE